MLISHEHEFILALPTKCGTISMRDMAFKWVRDGGDPDVLQELPKLRHRMDVPAGCEDYRRFIMVRNPHARLVSSFLYILTHANEWKTDELNRRLQNDYNGNQRLLFKWWCRMLLDERERVAGRSRMPYHGKRPYIWTDRLTEVRAFLGGEHADSGWPDREVGVVRIERVHRDWHRLLRECGVQGGIAGLEVPHHNRRGMPPQGGQRTGWWFDGGQHRRVVTALIGDDPLLLGYSGW